MGSLLVTVATVILVAFNLLERNLRTRLETFGVNTIIAREMVVATEPLAMPNQPRPDIYAPLREFGDKVRLRQFFIRANTPWEREIPVFSYADDALAQIGDLIHPKTPLVYMTDALPEGSLIEMNLDRHQYTAVVRRPNTLFRPLVSPSVLLVPQGWSPEAERIGYFETTLFRREPGTPPIPHFVSAIQRFFTAENRNPPQIQSALGMVKELESLQARQAQWRSAMAGLLGLAVALVFGAIAVLEFRQNAYVSALLRSFGAPGKALYLRQWIENALLINLAAISAIVILACFHRELFGLFGFPRDLLDLKKANPYFSWEIALILLWVNIGAFLSSLSVALGLRKPVGEILS